MLKVFRILVFAHALALCAVALGACGQKGPLVHPQDPLAADRASLLQTWLPAALKAPAAADKQPAAPPTISPQPAAKP
ncbi:MAG: hypothetical protein EBR17_00620 [Betaproteobacteria bacterium]|jgi:predicted small lipoprotein YifL|nr:lipoprotein [Burkholderiales bacterium]NBX13653.1 hypothetical protein [Betaproteobacteria bacterium]NBX89768.1 hypothetical protein [Betaproteobacteria bacterium]